MNLVGKLGLGIVALGIASAGAFAALPVYVESRIDALFEQVARENSIVESISYEEIDVDLLNNMLTIGQSSVQLNLDNHTALMPISNDRPISGSASQTIETARMDGVWSVILGNSKIEKLSLSNINLTESITVQIPDRIKKSKSQIPMKVDIQGSAPEITVYGLNLAKLADAKSVNLFFSDIDGFEIVTPTLDMAFDKQYPENDLAKFTDWTQQLEASYRFERIAGKGISPAHVDQLSYSGMKGSVWIAKSTAPDKKFDFNVSNIAIEDVNFDSLGISKMKFLIDEFSFDPNVLPAPQIQALLATFGIHEFNFNFELAFDYDETAHTLTVSPISFAAKQAGEINLSFGLEGLPGSDFFQDIAELKAAGDTSSVQALAANKRTNELMNKVMEQLAIKHLALGYKDFGVLRKFLAMQALQADQDVTVIVQVFSKQAEMILSQAYGPDIAADAQTKFQAFLENPDAIQIKLSAREAIKVKDLQKDFEVVGPHAFSQFQLDIN